MSRDLGKILVIDDDEDVLHAARLLLKKWSAQVHTERDPAQIPALLKSNAYDVILLDMNFKQDVSSGREGFFWLDKILEIDPSAVVVLITAFGDVAMAVEAIKEGATDFVLKPWSNDRLLATLIAASKLRRSRLQSDLFRQRGERLSQDLDHGFQEFVGRSPTMLKVFSVIAKVSKTDANVLILGDNGTGKELVARALHRQSNRRDDVFVNVDLGAIPETLFESELFGHVKGAFTDAREDRAGRFEVASEGTLFLDEIGNLTPTMQAKLLTVLQRREVIRVGSNTPRPIDVRVVCATNMPVYDLVREGRFRQDLLYRVNTVEIRIPPLRERTEDITVLVQHFLEMYAKKYQKTLKGVSPVALKKMEKYHWPGNVRELQHMVERAVIMTESNILQDDDFFFAAAGHGDENGALFDDLNLEGMEKAVIRKALEKHDGNISHAASELGLTRASLYRRLEKYGI